MNVIKKILIVLVVLVVLLYIVSLFLPSRLYVETSRVVNAPVENAFVQVNNLKNWEAWSPWLKMDPDLQITYHGPESGVGASYSWVSPSGKLGTGKITISESKPNELVVTDLDFDEEGSGTGGFRFEPEEDRTRITWYMDSRLEGMIDKYMGLMMAGAMENTFNEGLDALGTVAEQMPPPARTPDLVIEETRVAQLRFLGLRDTVDTTDLPGQLQGNFSALRKVLESQGLQSVGAPFAIYYITSEEDEAEMVDSWMPSIKPWRFDACMGVDGEGTAEGRVMPGMRPASAAVVAHYFGSYEGLHAAHTALNQYVEENGMTLNGPLWEEYITRPDHEPDTSKWQTDVYYPIKEKQAEAQ